MKPVMKKWEVFTQVWPANGAWVWFEPKTMTPKAYVPAHEGDPGWEPPCQPKKDWQSLFLDPRRKMYGNTKEEILDSLEDAISLARDEWYRSDRKERRKSEFLDTCDIGSLRSITELGKKVRERMRPEDEEE